MATNADPDRMAIPLLSLFFGYGPMAPFVAAAVCAWVAPAPWPMLATHLAIIWGGIILVFIAGVRRGYGFGDPEASTIREIGAMLLYFIFGGLSLVCDSLSKLGIALLLQMGGYILVLVLDRRAAFTGDTPPYFARLRVAQMIIASVALAALLARLLTRA